MSLLLSLEIRVNGVLTDADVPPTLQDPTAAFGVRRTDTLAIIAASGTAMTHDGTGLYSYTIASPVAGVTYEYWPKFTIDGNPVNYQQTKTYTTGATGTYADSTDLDDIYGATNVTIYSDLEDTGTRDTARIKKWLDRADDWIDLAFSRVGRTTPIASDQADFSALTLVAAEWAGAMLAKGRGDLPSGFSSRDAFDSLMDGHIERAEKRLAELVGAWIEANPDDDTEIVQAVQAIVPTREQGCGGYWW